MWFSEINSTKMCTVIVNNAIFRYDQKSLESCLKQVDYIPCTWMTDNQSLTSILYGPLRYS